MKNNKIICGFAGIGKSHLAKNTVGVVDLESTPFNKNWDLYTDVAIHMQKNGYTPLLSCHKELREELKKKNADFIIVIPFFALKQDYLQRYKNRGNTDTFIKMFDEKWENFIEEIIKSGDPYEIMDSNYLTIKLHDK